METTKKKVFVSPIVDHIQFEESTVIETSGNNSGRFGYRDWQQHENNPGNPNWHFRY